MIKGVINKLCIMKGMIIIFTFHNKPPLLSKEQCEELGMVVSKAFE